MKLFGWGKKQAVNTTPAPSNGFFGYIREAFTGAWQKGVEISPQTGLAFHAVYSCVTLIASDIAKLEPIYKVKTGGIWQQKELPSAFNVILKPNQYQNHIRFKESWLISKLITGNAYIYKDVDSSGKVVGLHVLNPRAVTPLVSDSGDVFYQIGKDNLATLEEAITVPAEYIIHDRMNCLFHPLVGISPLYASSLAINGGMAIQSQSTSFFAKSSTPSGILTAPGAVTQEKSDLILKKWRQKYGAGGEGGAAILTEGMTFTPLTMSAVDAQLIEQLKMNAEIVCSVFHVPAFLAGIGAAPAYNSVEALYQQYYNQCLQAHIESYEWALDNGLNTPKNASVELNIDGLLRMDSTTMNTTLTQAVSGALMSPNEARQKLNLPPVAGGESPYLQQQNYSLNALDKRDQENPLGAPAPETPNDDAEEAETDKALYLLTRKKYA